MKKFALVGAAGYIAPRHMKAIKDTHNELLAAHDISDSVGIIDSYFPNASFFTSFERFDRHIEKLKYEKKVNLDYISICSPNHFHDSHIRFALRSGADAICEKPLVLNVENLEKLIMSEEKTGKKVYNVLQLRLHPSVVKLKNKIINSPEKIFDVELTYITSRGNWYDYSWKGDVEKSGGIATNIGIHFFDMLCWIFGEQRNIKVFKNDSKVSLIGVRDKPGIAASIFKPLSKNSINVDMVVQNISANGKETDLTFTIKTDDLNKTTKIIRANKSIKFRKLLLKKDVAKISIIGVGMVATPGVTFRMFQTLANKKINIQVISTSEIKISVLIDKKNMKKALIALHKEFKLDEKR